MKHRDNVKFAFEKMRASETNDFVYWKWFGSGGYENFKQDVGRYLKKNFILFKKNEGTPFSPSNFRVGLKPKSKPHIGVVYKQKEIYDCFTLQLHISKGSDLSKSGIYKITFDNGWFYIGSTKNFRRRVGCTVGTFRGVSKLHNKNLIRCVAECDSAVFEVIEYIADVDLLKTRETEIIKPFIENPLLINRAYDGHSNKGIRWTDEEKAKVKNTLIKKCLDGKRKSKCEEKYPTSNILFNSKLFGDKEK